MDPLKTLSHDTPQKFGVMSSSTSFFYITKVSKGKQVCEIGLRNPKIIPYLLTVISQGFPSSLLVLTDHKRICGREGQSLPVKHGDGAHENG